MREKRSNSSGSNGLAVLLLRLDRALHLAFGGDLDLAKLGAHARDVLGEVAERALEVRHLALDRERAMDSSPASFTKRSIMSAFTRSSAARCSRISGGSASRSRHLLRGRRDHRDRRGLVLLVLEDRGDRTSIGSASTMSSPRARRSSDSEKAVDALLDLLEFARGGASEASSALMRVSSTWASSPRRMRPVMRALPLRVCRWRTSSAGRANDRRARASSGARTRSPAESIPWPQSMKIGSRSRSDVVLDSALSLPASNGPHGASASAPLRPCRQRVRAGTRAGNALHNGHHIDGPARESALDDRRLGNRFRTTGSESVRDGSENRFDRSVGNRSAPAQGIDSAAAVRSRLDDRLDEGLGCALRDRWLGRHAGIALYAPSPVLRVSRNPSAVP
jgi:hypothetical protein